MTKEEKRQRQILKIEVAKKLGYYDIITEQGWGALTASQSGRMGGIIAHMVKGEE